MKSDSPFQLLIVEDCAADADLMKMFLAESHLNINPHFLPDGEEASDFIFKRGKFAQSPTPDLIFMDLNLPNKNGYELMKEIKSHFKLCEIPVIMISTSSSEREISEAYCRGAAAFISKPLNVDTFKDMLLSAVSFWCRYVDLPTRPRARLAF